MSGLSSITTRHLNEVLDELIEDLQKDAVKAGWPEKLVKTISLSVDEKGLQAVYPEKTAKQIEDLEYGSSNTIPKPVFRLFVEKHSGVIAAAMAEGSIDYLFDSEILP
jgi:hypothetical protein